MPTDKELLENLISTARSLEYWDCRNDNENVRHFKEKLRRQLKDVLEHMTAIRDNK